MSVTPFDLAVQRISNYTLKIKEAFEKNDGIEANRLYHECVSSLMNDAKSANGTFTLENALTEFHRKLKEIGYEYDLIDNKLYSSSELRIIENNRKIQEMKREEEKKLKENVEHFRHFFEQWTKFLVKEYNENGIRLAGQKYEEFIAEIRKKFGDSFDGNNLVEEFNCKLLDMGYKYVSTEGKLRKIKK